MTNERDELRQVFFEAWRKYQNQLLLEPLENQLVELILQHPEYQPLFERPEEFQDQDFAEENPFLHLSLHLSIRDQINADRPEGVKQIYQLYCQKLQDTNTAEHLMMECLGQVLWEAQQSGKMPEEQSYIELLKSKI